MNTPNKQQQTSCCAAPRQSTHKQTVTTEESFSSSAGVPNLPSCSVLTNDCCNKDFDKAGKLHKNLILEQKEGNNVWNYYEEESLIGEGSISAIYKVSRKEYVDKSDSYYSIFCCKCLPKQRKPKKAISSTLDKKDTTPKKKHYYALKMIDTRLVNDEFLQEMKNEIEIFKSMDHPNVLKAYETFHRKKEISIIMELCTGGDLYTRLPYSERQAAEIMKQLLSAVAYMHKNRIIHRDLKFENVMFESTAPDANVKVIDFGLSKKYLDPNSIIRDRVGTVYTMAPEVIEGVPYTSKTDMFSLGVIAYMLLSGTKPFWGRTKYEVARMARRCIYNFDGHVWSKISDDAKDFVSKLLVKDPSVRLSAVEAKRHVWLEKINLLSNKKPDMKLMNGVEESIVRFSDSGDFKKIVLNVLAHRTTTEDILELRKAFDSFDKENDGFISYDEFKEALSHINLGEEDLDRIFKSMDVNNTGDIMYNEFIAATLEAQHHIDEANLRDAFDRLDNDGTGYISKKNLCCVLGEHCTDEYVNNIIREVDVDGDGEISYDEFIAAFRQQKKNDIEKCGLVNDECVE